jgi:FkbH-like protein
VKEKISCLLIGNFTLDNLAAYLNNDRQAPTVCAKVAPFNQVTQILMDKDSKYWGKGVDCALIWTLPEIIIKSFEDVLMFKKVDWKQICMQIDQFTALLSHIREEARYILVSGWTVPSYMKGWGLLDMKTNVGISNTVMRMNIRLAENLEKIPNAFIMPTEKWVASVGKNAFNPKLWYMGKIAFDNEVFKLAAKDIKAALAGAAGLAKKIIIVDLDDTLWGGIVGEVGKDNLRLGGIDPVGEAFVDFQKALKSYVNRGILLGIVSKNEEKVALEAIQNHPEMILKPDDFAAWKINWEDKAKNIVDLVHGLNLGLQSAVFIDDNPSERDRVRKALPEVYVPEWPEDKMLYKSALENLSCFDTISVSEEDRLRSRMFVSERKRKKEKLSMQSLEGWLKSLKTSVFVNGLDKTNIQRTAQLLNKTNQLNLTTRRMSESELMKWAAAPDHKLWVVRVSDKFGDLGLIGIISIEINKKRARIVDFVLSCRVFGKHIEETMLYIVYNHAASQKLKEIHAQYIPTEKNKPCLEFWKKSRFRAVGKNCFSWDVKKQYPKPSFINIEVVKK